MMSDKLLNTFANFEQWRSQKSARNSATPEHLCRQAVALLSHYSKTKIVTKLRISTEQFNRWCLLDKAPDELPQFIQLPQMPPASGAISIEAKFSNGNQLIFSGKLDEHVITQLIEAVK